MKKIVNDLSFFFQKEPGSRKFAFTGACKGRRKDTKLGDLSHSSKNLEKKWRVLHKKIRVLGLQVQLGHGTPVKGIYPYKIEFHRAGWCLYLSAVQGFVPRSSLQEEKFEVGRFYGLSDTRWEKGKRNNSKEVLKSGLPNSLV